MAEAYLAAFPQTYDMLTSSQISGTLITSGTSIDVSGYSKYNITFPRASVTINFTGGTLGSGIWYGQYYVKSGSDTVYGPESTRVTIARYDSGTIIFSAYTFIGSINGSPMDIGLEIVRPNLGCRYQVSFSGITYTGQLFK